MGDAELQRAAIRLTAGDAARIETSVRVTPRGLLAIGGLVAAILLSTAVLVGVAVRESKA